MEPALRTRGRPGRPRANPQADDGPLIFTALQEQLGLKLESTRGPVEILVVDHVDIHETNKSLHHNPNPQHPTEQSAERRGRGRSQCSSASSHRSHNAAFSHRRTVAFARQAGQGQGVNKESPRLVETARGYLRVILPPDVAATTFD